MNINSQYVEELQNLPETHVFNSTINTIKETNILMIQKVFILP